MFDRRFGGGRNVLVAAGLARDDAVGGAGHSVSSAGGGLRRSCAPAAATTRSSTAAHFARSPVAEQIQDELDAIVAKIKRDEHVAIPTG